MASLLRQIVAGPRAKHPEAGLDLCYVTDYIIATSGPSQTYPQRAYRNPLDRLVEFLDAKHGDNWAIWEFRAEGTGYPDHLVYDRVRHYPFPDHHPPPFRLVPMILASMRNWLHGGELDAATAEPETQLSRTEGKGKDRVVVVHCKAGKGRSGTMSCSYLIAEEGWKAEDALARFTERRMRPKFGEGVTIPSQLRWITYVDRWAHNGKKYNDRPIEVVEIHIWGLRNGVKVDVEGFVDEGKKIEVFHTFKKEERNVVQGNAPEAGGLSDMVWDMAGYPVAAYSRATGVLQKDDEDVESGEQGNGTPTEKSSPLRSKTGSIRQKGAKLIQRAKSTNQEPEGNGKAKGKTFPPTNSTLSPNSASNVATEPSEGPEPGGMAVVLKPQQPVRVPTNDVNISVELRNKAHKSIGLTLVSAVAHVWFNAFFEGNGPEQGGKPEKSGVFAIDWDAMDGIKGSSRKGARALDRIAVVWREADTGVASAGEEVSEPAKGEPVPQMQAADWKGANDPTPDAEKDLGFRTQSPASAEVSKASSVKSADMTTSKDDTDNSDGQSLHGVKSSGPGGEELDDDTKAKRAKDVLENPDRASGTTKEGEAKVV